MRELILAKRLYKHFLSDKLGERAGGAGRRAYAAPADGFRKSTPPQTRQPSILTSNSKQLSWRFYGGVDFLKLILLKRAGCVGRRADAVPSLSPQCINEMVLESQLPHKIVKLLSYCYLSK